MIANFEKFEWENDAHTIATFYFKPSAPYTYQAGQYAIISLPHFGEDERGNQRTMTLSSSPDDELLAFTVRIISSAPYDPANPDMLRGDAGSSFKRALLALQPGAPITVFESLGDLVLPLSGDTPLVFIAGGVGIASFTGMAKWLAQHGDARIIQLHYLVARREDIVMQSVFNEYARTFPGHLTGSLYTPDVKMLTPQDILDIAEPNSLFYISGTEKMVEEIRQGLMDGGIPRGQIIFDFFDGYSDL